MAQLDNDGYKKEMQRLRQATRIVEQRHAAATGQARPKRRGIMTPQEQQALNAQGHYHFRELAPGEQEHMKGELVGMWSQIPKHLLPKLAEWQKR